MNKQTSNYFGHRLMTILCTGLGTLLVSATSTHAGDSRPMTVPATFQVDLGAEGTVLNQEIESREHIIYTFDLKVGFPEGAQNERRRVRQLVGGHETDAQGRQKEPGVPTPLRLVIKKIERQGEHDFFVKEIDPRVSGSEADGFIKSIGFCDLPKGLYRLQVVNLRASPEFSSTRVELLVGQQDFKTSFDPKTVDRKKSCSQ